jgi:hypothetical protein
MVFPWSWLRFFRGKRKSPLAGSPAGLGDSLDLSGRLLQAMAVRRHGSSMMMVVTVMAAALHLIFRLRENWAYVK